MEAAYGNLAAGREVGVLSEVAQRARHYADDWRLRSHVEVRKTLAATFFMYFATVASTIALGALAERSTHGRLGVSEYLAANGAVGIAHAAFGCQPLLVMRPTGPITLFLQKIEQAATLLKLPFFPLLAWTGAFVGLYMTVTALCGWPRHVFRLTGFALDVFACFVSSVYVHDGLNGALGPLAHLDRPGPSHRVGTILARTAMATALALVALGLQHLRRTTSRLASLVADYALTLATLATTAVSFAVSQKVHVDRVHIESDLAPTDPDRRWGEIAYGVSDPTAIAAGAAIAVCIAFFFFFDQNISSLLCQEPALGLRKGAYFHASYLVVGLFSWAGPMLGMPFATGSLPHSPQLVKALSLGGESDPDDRDDDEDDRRRGDLERELLEDGSDVAPPRVVEARYAPLAFYALILLSGLVAEPAIRALPLAAVDGVLIFVGLDGIFDTLLWRRVRRLFVCPCYCGLDATPAKPAFAPHQERLFAAIQLLVLAAAWGLNVSPAGLLFPLVIVALVPIRDHLLPRLIDRAALDAIDPPRPTAA